MYLAHPTTHRLSESKLKLETLIWFELRGKGKVEVGALHCICLK